MTITSVPTVDRTPAAASRRDLIKAGGGALLLAGVAGCLSREAERPADAALAEPLYYSSAGALAAAIRRGELTSEALVTACLARIEAVNPALNAVVQLDSDAALARAREADAALARGESWGPLHGVPMTIKDSFDTAGLISTGGTLGRREFVPDQDATVVARLRGAGAILLGKTNTPELTLSFETNNLIYGRTSNPYDLTRSSGGSSGGAAAIVAVGGAPFDIGSDYAGSIRLPAHFCGIAGIKPSAGRVPRTGHIFPFGGVQDSFQQIGPLARSVDDLILLLPLIMGPDFVDPGVVPLPWSDPRSIDLAGLRVSFHTDNGVLTPDAAIRATVEAAARALGAEARVVAEQAPAGIEQGFELGFGVPAWDGNAHVRRLLAAAGTSEHTLQSFMEAEPLDAVAADLLIARWYGWRSRMLGFFEDFDVIVCPVNAKAALPHGFMSDPEVLAAFSYTATYNAAGWPGVVVRAGTSPEGLPIGVQIVAAPGREDVALAVARFIESSLGGYARPAL